MTDSDTLIFPDISLAFNDIRPLYHLRLSQNMVERHHRTLSASMFPGTQMVSVHECMHLHDPTDSLNHELRRIFVHDLQRYWHRPRMVLPGSVS